MAFLSLSWGQALARTRIQKLHFHVQADEKAESGRLWVKWTYSPLQVQTASLGGDTWA